MENLIHITMEDDYIIILEQFKERNGAWFCDKQDVYSGHFESHVKAIEFVKPKIDNILKLYKDIQVKMTLYTFQFVDEKTKMLNGSAMLDKCVLSDVYLKDGGCVHLIDLVKPIYTENAMFDIKTNLNKIK